MGSNWSAGHGHVYKREDGVKAKCGGPRICSSCAIDLARFNADIAEKYERLNNIDERIRLARAETWDEAQEATMEWYASQGSPGPNDPTDPPRNPYDEKV